MAHKLQEKIISVKNILHNFSIINEDEYIKAKAETLETKPARVKMKK